MIAEHSETIIFCLTAGTVLALFASLAIWATVARRPHWFVRFAILLGAIGLLLPVIAYDAAVYFLYQSALIIGSILTVRVALTLLRRMRGRRSTELDPSQPHRKPQATLKDLFFVTTLVSITVAIATAAAKHFPTGNSHQLHGPVVLTALVALTVAMAVGSRGRWWWSVLCGAIFLATTAAAYRVVSLNRLTPLGYGEYLDFMTSEFEGHVVTVYAALMIAVFALWRISFLASTRKPFDPIGDGEMGMLLPKVSRCARITLIAMGIVIACPLGYLYWRMASPPAIPPARTGEPNNIDELLAIAKRFEYDTLPDEDNSYKGLKAFAATHAAIGGEVRGALARPSFIPVSYTNYAGLDEIFELFNLAHALELIGRDAENRGQNQQAINVYWDIMRLGHLAAGDGLLIECLVGRSIERLGLNSLRKMRRKLSTQQRRELIRELDRSENAIGPLDGFIRRDKIWAMHAAGWQGRLQMIVVELTGGESELFNEQYIRDMLNRDLASRRMLVIAMALSIYRDDHGDLPESLDQLVPKVLPRVIEDPFGSASFVYRRQNDQRYVLYSLGNNRRDDGGVIVTESGKSVLIKNAPEDLPADHSDVDLDQGDFFFDQSVSFEQEFDVGE